MKTIITLPTALAVALVLRSGAPAAGPPGGLNVTEQNVDPSGSIRVHEQGTANVNVTNSSLPVTVQNVPAVQNVRVTNSPLAVSGTVDVGNFPLDADGNLRVTAPPQLQRGRLSWSQATSISLLATSSASQARSSTRPRAAV